jgi:hypothetical protein
MPTPEVTLETISADVARVLVDGRFVGRAERINIGVQKQPGVYGSEDRWFAVTPNHVADAYPERSGCASFSTRREAVAALTAPYLPKEATS